MREKIAYISKISEIGRYGRIVSSNRTERSEASGTGSQLWSPLLRATLLLNLALQCTESSTALWLTSLLFGI